MADKDGELLPQILTRREGQEQGGGPWSAWTRSGRPGCQTLYRLHVWLSQCVERTVPLLLHAGDTVRV